MYKHIILENNTGNKKTHIKAVARILAPVYTKCLWFKSDPAKLFSLAGSDTNEIKIKWAKKAN